MSSCAVTVDAHRYTDSLGCASAYLADEFGSHVRRVAELPAHLQVADAADGVPELCQTVGAQHQQGGVGSDEVKLRRKWTSEICKMGEILEELVKMKAHFLGHSWVVDVNGQNDLSFWDLVGH